VKKKKGFTLIELLVVVAIIALLISILLPSLSRARELAKRMTCGTNVRGIGTSCKIYANENEEMWPLPAFQDNISVIKQWCIDAAADPSGVGTNQQGMTPRNIVSDTTTTALSVTRCFWMLVRSGEVSPKQFICPSSGDQPDTGNAELFYDFEKIGTISYGYRVPYGPNDTRPSENLDNRIVVVADKGPIGTASVDDAMWERLFNTSNGVFPVSPPAEWVPFNSPNHGGKGQGEGQNCLFADGHTSFERKPIAGIDNDNIYSAFTPNIGLPINRAKGTIKVKPSGRVVWYPGQDSMGTGPGGYSSTDSLIWP